MLKRVLTESLKVEMTWRLAMSMMVGAAVAGAGTMTWAYAYGEKVLFTADHHTDQKLREYVTYSDFVDKLDALEQQNSKRHEEVMERLIRLEATITLKERRNGRH